MIRAVHHAQVSIPPGTENEARSFYCGVLGLTEIPESDEDMELLRSLKGQNHFDILFSDSYKIKYSIRVYIKEEERKVLGAILDEATS